MGLWKLFDLKKKRQGAILIEFAFAIPILSMVIFFMTDAPRYYYIKSKMRNSAHLAANLIQNATQQSSNTKISTTHLINIFCSALANHYNGFQSYEKSSNSYVLGHTFSAYVYYIECTSSSANKESSVSNQAKVVWCWHTKDIKDPQASSTFEYIANQDANSLINFSGTTANAIYSNMSDGLRIARGDAKIIVEIGLVSKKFSDSRIDNNPVEDKNDSARKRFGFLMLPIRPSVGESYFNAVVIFTPKPGLFDDKRPNE